MRKAGHFAAGAQIITLELIAARAITHAVTADLRVVGFQHLVVVDDHVDVHNTSDILFHLCANTDPQRDSIFTKGPADVLDQVTSEIVIGRE